MLVKRLERLGQDHIARLLSNEVNPLLMERIATDLEGVDIDLVDRLIRGESLYEPPQGGVEPADVIPATFASSKEALVYILRGQELLRSGKVAALVVAGGQGSRLGIDAPKGVVGVTPVKGKSLFNLFAEKILALEHKFRCTVPWFIMTSRENDGPTKEYFRDNGYFGLNQDHVYFFIQGMLPSVTDEGKFIIGEGGGLFMNPDGHGGTFNALRTSGSLSLMKDLGIEEIFYFQVDNPLAKVCDTLFIGLHNLSGAQMSSKVVRKSTYEEKVGVITSINNKTTLLEYSDMSDEVRYAKGSDGEMLHWAGNLAIHMITRTFAEEITAQGTKLPFHRARKMITAQGPDHKPMETLGIKFEAFLFDALPLAEKSITLEVLREEEFAPVKNLTGADSLESSRLLQSALYKSWLKRLGVDVGADISVEISPLFALDYEDLLHKASTLPRHIGTDTFLG
jgi:UDP-N-acetylglucosamine/UDP-N-acetylgalactosamine diphosphorylase